MYDFYKILTAPFGLFIELEGLDGNNIEKLTVRTNTHSHQQLEVTIHLSESDI